jgi:hypothetical protein
MVQGLAFKMPVAFKRFKAARSIMIQNGCAVQWIKGVHGKSFEHPKHWRRIIEPLNP